MRRAKIVCTMGPAVSEYATVLGLVRAGMDVARLNLSHGTHEAQKATFENVRKASEETGRGVGVLVDLQGPKIRVGVFPGGPVQVARGDSFVITTEKVPGSQTECSTSFTALPGDVSPDDLILVDDGRVTLRVTAVDGPRISTEVVEGGAISDHKGLNLPGVAISAPALTEKDASDLTWALHLGADMVALSFVRSASDIDAVHELMDKQGRRVPVLAKVEKPEAIAHLDEIVAAFDGVMVARGDLGVEMPLERVPLEQKRAIDLCRRRGKPVIVATQMLESMVSASRPTRAEVSDVANAVLDGADALMLSEETSVGKDPELVVRTMARIIGEVERKALDRVPQLAHQSMGSTARAMTRAGVEVADAVEAVRLIAFTETGSTARLISRHRSPVPLLAFTPSPSVRSWLSLVWGVEAFLASSARRTDELVEHVDAALMRDGTVKKGERVVIVAGVPPGVPGTTNGMRVHVVGRDWLLETAPADNEDAE